MEEQEQLSGKAEEISEAVPGEIDEQQPQVETQEPDPGPIAAETISKAPSRIGQFLRRSLRWSTAVAVVFGLGVMVVWALRVRPLNQSNEQLRAELASAQGRLASLEEQLGSSRALASEMSRDLQKAQDDVLAMQTGLQQAQTHLEFLRVLVEVTSAQLAMAQDDPLAARAALAETDGRLEALQAGLEGDQAAQVRELRQRLSLALDEVDDNAFSAKRDLEILANNLIALEVILYGK